MIKLPLSYTGGRQESAERLGEPCKVSRKEVANIVWRVTKSWDPTKPGK